MTTTISVVTNHEEPTVTTAEAMALLGLDRSAVIRYVSLGRLEPARKLPGVNGAYLFHRADVVALAAERRADLQAALDRIGAS